MDYAVLTNFREALQKFVNNDGNSNAHSTAHAISVITRFAEKLGPSVVLEELQHILLVVTRFRIVRHLPHSHRLPILESCLLHPPPKTAKESRHFLAAHVSSLEIEWTPTPAHRSLDLDRALRNLKTMYQPITTTATRATTVPTEVNRLLNDGNIALRALHDVISVITEDEGLQAVEENIEAQWAILRSLSTRLDRLVPDACKLCLDSDISLINNFYTECYRTQQHIANRDVDIPEINVPLGAGNVHRVPQYALNALAVNEDSEGDSDDWDDPVELARPSVPVTTSQSAPSSPEHSEHKNTGVQLNARTSGPTQSGAGRVAPLDFGGVLMKGTSKEFNKSLLDALEAGNHSNTRPKGWSRNTKKTTARERLSTKLGIKKRKRKD